MTLEERRKLVAKITEDVMADVTDRRGWRQAWDSFDKDIQMEIIATWIVIIDKDLEAAGV